MRSTYIFIASFFVSLLISYDEHHFRDYIVIFIHAMLYKMHLYNLGANIMFALSNVMWFRISLIISSMQR